MKEALERHGPPEAIIRDGLRPYKAAVSALGNAEKQEACRWAMTPVLRTASAAALWPPNAADRSRRLAR